MTSSRPMQLLCAAALILLSFAGFTQNIQLHYDLRHTLDPKHNPENYPVLSFEYFKSLDTLGTGSFLVKIQADLNGENNNVGQVFLQVGQSLKFWKGPVALSINYSGGLGVVPGGYGYHISNGFGIGASCPLQWREAWIALNLQYRYTAFQKPSHDGQFTFYYGRGFMNYRILTSGSLVFWSENLDQGTEATKGQQGKKLAFFGDPQIWIKVRGEFSVGTRVNVYYHIYTPQDRVQLYPTLGMRYQF